MSTCEKFLVLHFYKMAQCLNFFFFPVANFSAQQRSRVERSTRLPPATTLGP